ncbi:MAG: hypothetical protein Q7S60_01630 [bacterium]|nr:hypothetical protein [bacterium]
MNQKLIAESLSMDLLRVALGFHRGSITMANRFQKEAFKRVCELEQSNPTSYLEKLLLKVKTILSTNNDRLSDDALMYSTLFKNISTKLK